MGLGADGSPGPHLPRWTVGTAVEIDGPIGTFRYPDRLTDPAVLFVAGGSGIAPLRAMLHEALTRARSAGGERALQRAHRRRVRV